MKKSCFLHITFRYLCYSNNPSFLPPAYFPALFLFHEMSLAVHLQSTCALLTKKSDVWPHTMILNSAVDQCSCSSPCLSKYGNNLSNWFEEISSLASKKLSSHNVSNQISQLCHIELFNGRNFIGFHFLPSKGLGESISWKRHLRVRSITAASWTLSGSTLKLSCSFSRTTGHSSSVSVSQAGPLSHSLSFASTVFPRVSMSAGFNFWSTCHPPLVDSWAFVQFFKFVLHKHCLLFVSCIMHL